MDTTIREILKQVTDPEIPVLTVLDMGIVRQVNRLENGGWEIVITPTYTGCPAMDMIEVGIRAAMQEHGHDNVKVTTVLSPAWTTDWMTAEGKRKLKEYGIAPPIGPADKYALLGKDTAVECPRCGSLNAKMVSQFGSTACKALYQCRECLEPFDYFKCH